jgi:hypothetical protein
MADPTPLASDAVARDQGYEPDQPKLAGLVLGALAIIGAVVVAIVVAWLIVRGLADDETAEQPRRPPTIVGGPRLQPMPERDFPAFHAEKSRLIHEYGWVDRSRGIVRIPIEQAMALLAAQGAKQGPARAPAPGQAQGQLQGHAQEQPQGQAQGQAKGAVR